MHEFAFVTWPLDALEALKIDVIYEYSELIGKLLPIVGNTVEIDSVAPGVYSNFPCYA